jgi:hypothetical protein
MDSKVPNVPNVYFGDEVRHKLGTILYGGEHVNQHLSYFLIIHHESTGVRHGVFKRVKDCRRPPALRVGHP